VEGTGFSRRQERKRRCRDDATTFRVAVNDGGRGPRVETRPKKPKRVSTTGLIDAIPLGWRGKDFKQKIGIGRVGPSFGKRLVGDRLSQPLSPLVPRGEWEILFFCAFDPRVADVREKKPERGRPYPGPFSGHSYGVLGVGNPILTR
jgi:hypothetical protein